MENQLIYVPVHRLNPAPHDVRKTNGVPIDDLVASIRAEGLLQNLTVVRDPESPLDGATELQNFHVVAGRRRLRAIKRLVDDGALPLEHSVPCLLIEDAKALTASLAENAIRVQMHPADEFTAFKEMVDDGKSVEDISARFGVTPIVVQRRLKLANVSPKIFDLYRTGAGVTLEQMMALALVDNHKVQETAWFGAKDEWQRSPANLRKAVLRKEVDATRDPVARFVGVTEYERAGGVLRRDLFDDKSAGYITDVDLLKRLAAEKLEAVAAEVRKEAWSFVIVRDRIEAGELSEYSRAPASQRKPTDIERKKLAELEKERKAAEKRLEELDQLENWNDEHIEEEERLRERLFDGIDFEEASIRESLNRWDPKILAKAGAAVHIDQDGNVEIIRGLVKGKLAATKETTAKEKKAKEKKIAEGAGLPDTLVRELSASTSMAITAELIANPGAALIALTHKLVLDVFYRGNYGLSVVGIAGKLAVNDLDDLPGGMSNPDAAKQQMEHKALRALLPKEPKELLGWLSEKGAPISRLLAYCTAVSVDATVHSEKALEAWAARPLAEGLQINMSTRWTANAENFANRVSAAHLRAAMADAGADKAAIAATETMKKSELVAAALKMLAPANWLPKFMRFTAPKAGAKK